MSEGASEGPATGAIEALLAALPRHRQAHILRELRARATPAPAPERARVNLLGALGEMLRGREPERGLGYPTIPQAQYMARRPPGAPTDEALVKRFGAWIYACRAAALLAENGASSSGSNGRSHSPRHSRPNLDRGRRRQPPYTREEILRAIRQCALETGVRPSSATYDRWVIRKRAEARRHGKLARLPRAQQIYRLFPVSEGGYNAALGAALVNEAEVVAANAQRLGYDLSDQVETPATALEQLDEHALVNGGIDGQAIELVLK